MLTSMSIEAPDCAPLTLMNVRIRFLLFFVPYVLKTEVESALAATVNWQVEPPDGLTPPDCEIKYVAVSPDPMTSGDLPEIVMNLLLTVISKIGSTSSVSMP